MFESRQIQYQVDRKVKVAVSQELLAVLQPEYMYLPGSRLMTFGHTHLKRLLPTWLNLIILLFSTWLVWDYYSEQVICLNIS